MSTKQEYHFFNCILHHHHHHIINNHKFILFRFITIESNFISDHEANDLPELSIIGKLIITINVYYSKVPCSSVYLVYVFKWCSTTIFNNTRVARITQPNTCNTYNMPLPIISANAERIINYNQA